MMSSEKVSLPAYNRGAERNATWRAVIDGMPKEEETASLVVFTGNAEIAKLDL